MRVAPTDGRGPHVHSGAVVARIHGTGGQRAW